MDAGRATDGGVSEETYARLLGAPDPCSRGMRTVGASRRFLLRCNTMTCTTTTSSCNDGAGTTYRIFDWGDASIAHPFGTLLVSLRSFARSARRPSDDPRVTPCGTPISTAGPTWRRMRRAAGGRAAGDLRRTVGRALSWQRGSRRCGSGGASEWDEASGDGSRSCSPRRDKVDGDGSAGRVAARGTHPGLGTTIFAEMSALATATGSVNLGQGFPDTDGPIEVVDAAVARDPQRASTSTRPDPGIPRAAGVRRLSPGALHRADVRPRDRGPRHHRRHGGHRGRTAGARRPW